MNNKKKERNNKKYKIQKEEIGWIALAEQSLNKVWNNKKDKKLWRKHLDNL